YYILTSKTKKMKSLYPTTQKPSLTPFKISQSTTHIFQNLTINPHPTIPLHHHKYHIQLSHIHIKTQILLKFPHIYPQIYIHQHTNQILPIPYLHTQALLQFKPYQILNPSNHKQLKTHFHHLPYQQNPNHLITLYQVTNQIPHLPPLPPLKLNNHLANIPPYNLYQPTPTHTLQFTQPPFTQQLQQNQLPFQSP
ncbi:CAP-associated domain-containing protein, partial [Staphylococcus auricularis]|uniref:CAP-associated domain-containing protein n=1 Tax=Staphylococcus auricularis TaxID=29379 RepID=UPI0021E6CAAD